MFAAIDAPVDTVTCAPVTASVDVDPWAMRVPGTPYVRDFSDATSAYLLGPDEYVQIGASLTWGGSVTYFGLPSVAGSNTIDANDPGRELQIALYDPARIYQPCAATASCVGATPACGASITFLGWDPVQGGDRCGHGAKVLSSGRVGDALRMVVQPLQWNPGWDRPTCDSTCGEVPAAVTYTLDYRFVDKLVVEIAIQVDSAEAIDHAATGQEFPTLYVAHGAPGPDLARLLDSAGGAVAIDVPANDGFVMKDFTSPAPWVTFQNADSSYGVALAMDQGIRGFQGWAGGTSSVYFHNVRAPVPFGLPAGGRVRGLAYLALGSLATDQSTIPAVLSRRPPFGVVDAPAAGTTTSGAAIDVAGWVLDGDPVTSVVVELDGVAVKTVTVDVARPDACAIYPAYPGCPTAGFRATVSTSGLSPCPHLLRVVATDKDGNRTVLGERVVKPG
ncbi:MAG: hypothetical protein NVS3B10_27930 [Polyangiales bacterium]